MSATRKSTKSASTLSPEELAALQETVRERKRTARRGDDRAAGLEDLRAKIAEMSASDRAMAEKIHEIVTEIAPDLLPKTWYGMPAWADEAGKAVCFFTPAGKFKERYASFGFNANAHLDEGNMWPTAYALTRIGPADEERIRELVKQAVS